MNKPWIHADLLEFVANLADVNCSATISDGVVTLEDGTQIDLYALLPQPQEKIMFNHAFDMAVQVESEYDDFYRVLQNEPEKVKQAILDRVESMFKDREYLEALSSFDSYEVEE